MTEPGELYYGPPTSAEYCSWRYPKAGLRCPDFIEFYVKIPDGREGDWRKARASCIDHLAAVIWQLSEDHGGYDGDYLIRAHLMTGSQDGG